MPRRAFFCAGGGGLKTSSLPRSRSAEVISSLLGPPLGASKTSAVDLLLESQRRRRPHSTRRRHRLQPASPSGQPLSRQLKPPMCRRQCQRPRRPSRRRILRRLPRPKDLQAPQVLPPFRNGVPWKSPVVARRRKWSNLCGVAFLMVRALQRYAVCQCQTMLYRYQTMLYTRPCCTAYENWGLVSELPSFTPTERPPGSSGTPPPS